MFLKKSTTTCLITFFTLSTCLLNAAIVTRAAVDIGSVGHKLTVADVDTSSNKIEKIHFSTELAVPFKRDMQVSGQNRLSDKVQQRSLDTLASLKTKVASYNPKEWKGIATAASRQAENAPEMYERIYEELGIRVTIIPQSEEGHLGFLTASTVSGIDNEHLVAYDSGSGSFQLTTQIGNKLEVIGGKIGYIATLATLMNEVRGLKFEGNVSPNPVSLDEVHALIPLLKKQFPSPSAAFLQKLKAPETTVIGIGNENFIFAFGAIATGKNKYTKEDLWKAIEEHAGRTDEALKNFAKPDEAVVGMVLLYSVMDNFGIDQLTYNFANGCCEGLLVDPKYWTITE